jgi:hypothetical protein
MTFFASQGTSPAEFLFGRYEPPPHDLGTWREAGTHQRTGQLREERLLLPNGNPRAGYLLRQVRYRDSVTRAIASVEPEQRVARRRTKARL